MIPKVIKHLHYIFFLCFFLLGKIQVFAENQENSLILKAEIKTLLSSYDYSLVLTEDGRVYSWGDNAHGQLGHGDTKSRMTPTLIKALQKINVKEIFQGYDASFILSHDGSVYSWGNGDDGQLGLGDTKNRETPTQIHFPSGVTVSKFFIGYSQSFALTEDGRVYSWGNNYYSQLGFGDHENRHTPTLVEGLLSLSIKDIFLGEEHCFALTEEGQVYSWGLNFYGQLGRGHNENHDRGPEHVVFPDGVRIAKLYPSDDSSFALTEDGKLYSWGRSRNGGLCLGEELGEERMVMQGEKWPGVFAPTLVRALEDKVIKEIFPSLSKTLILDEMFHMYLCGRDSGVFIGKSSDDRAHHYLPTESFLLKDIDITFMGKGLNIYFVKDKDEQLWIFGNNDRGQLGLGKESSFEPPTRIDFNGKKGAIKSIITDGLYHVCNNFILLDDGSVYVWGDNYRGELGLGDNERRRLPVLSLFLLSPKSLSSSSAKVSYDIGLMFEEGRGVLKDKKQALYWFKRSAEQGYVLGEYKYGMMLLNGVAVRRDRVRAAHFFESAASKGDAFSQYELGLMHETGYGMPQDARQSLYWYEKSSESEYLPAVKKLGWAYGTGYGTEKDYKKSLYWYEKASEQGDSQSKHLVQKIKETFYDEL